MSTEKIKEGLKAEGLPEASEVKGKERFNYIMPVMERMYKELNPSMVTLKNQIIYLNSSQDQNDNAYMFMLQDLYREASPTHTACLNLRIDMVIGNGLSPVVADPLTQEFLDKPNRIGDTLQQVLEKIVFDYELTGMYAIQCLYSQEGKIVEVLHTDISTVRAVSPVDGEEYVPYIDTWAISGKWAEIRDKNRYTPNNSAAFIKNFNPKDWAKDGARQLLVHRDYQSGNFPYGLPHYNSVLRYVSLDEQLSRYHLNKVAGGFFPNVIVQLAGNPDEETKQKFVNKFKIKYLGPDREKIMFIWSEGDDGVEPKIIPFSTNDDNEIFEILDKITTQKILSSHQVLPELASLPSAGAKLGGEANTINVGRQYMIESVIKPIQKSILSSINKIFRHNGLKDVTVSNEVLKLTPKDNESGNEAETN